jgi:hypothetical protein
LVEVGKKSKNETAAAILVYRIFKGYGRQSAYRLSAAIRPAQGLVVAASALSERKRTLRCLRQWLIDWLTSAARVGS